MKREADNAEFWLGNSGKQELMKARNFMERLDMLTDLCVKKDVSPYDFTDNVRLTKSVIKSEISKLVRIRGRAANGSRNNNITDMGESGVLNDVSEMLADWEDDDTRII